MRSLSFTCLYIPRYIVKPGLTKRDFLKPFEYFLFCILCTDFQILHIYLRSEKIYKVN